MSSMMAKQATQSRMNWLADVTGETLCAGPYTADLMLKVPASLNGPKRTENAAGRIWVTDHRVCSHLLLPSSEQDVGG